MIGGEIMSEKISEKNSVEKYCELYRSIEKINNGYFSKLQKNPILNLQNDTHSKMTFGKFTKEDIVKWLKSPEDNARQLRNASIYLYETSSHYRRLIDFFANLLTFDYTLVPFKFDKEKYNEQKFLSSYKKALDYMQIFNLKHEMKKVMTVAFREDVFYGYIYQTKDSFYIRKLNADYCKISSIEDGIFLYAFDFSYFDSRKDELEFFGEEFKEKYLKYKKDSKLKWQELESKNEFCIKVTEDIFPAPIIPFASIFPDIFDIMNYKDLKLTREELENYKIIGLKIPTNEDGELILDGDIAKSFYSQLINTLPLSVGAFLTPMDFEAISFEKSGTNDNDLANDAVENFWNSAGVSSILFGKAQTAASLAISIKADIQFAYGVAKQIERNVNRLLKMLSGTYKFQINILPVSEFTKQEMNSLYQKNATFGIPCKTLLAASAGLTPAEINGLTFLENEIIDFQNNWKPLLSSYTQNTDEIGNEELSDMEISENGEKTRESESNSNR